MNRQTHTSLLCYIQHWLLAIVVIGLPGYAFANSMVPELQLIKTGLMPLYDYDGEKRQDISAAAIGNGMVLLGDDGGTNADYQEIRISRSDSLASPAPLLKRQVKQKDIEGMTFNRNSFYVTSSMSQVFEESDDYLVLAELSVDPVTKKVSSEKYVYMRDAIVNSLRDRFQNQEWYGRISTSFAKEGGINVEGLSTSHLSKDALVFGLRSPLWSKNFGSSKFGSNYNLTTGEALLVHVKGPFGHEPEFTVEAINLHGKGIRALEYIPQLLGGGYLIVAGPVEKDSSAFGLWWYQPGAAPQQVDIPEFRKLCRPESIMFDAKKKHIFILSEQSGESCSGQEYTFLEFSY